MAGTHIPPPLFDESYAPQHINTTHSAHNRETSYDSDDDLYMSATRDDDDDGMDQTPPSPPVPPHGASAINIQSTETPSDAATNSSADMDIKASQGVPAPMIDLASSVTGMYRILDLISEQGSGGLVDKIIIAQDSLREFINALSPGAYVSLTKVDFKALDQLAIKPIGMYGSKAQIVRFLASTGAIDETTGNLLLASEGDKAVSKPTLRSGLYIIRSPNAGGDGQQIYVVYWPQDTTWDDSAFASIRRNRVTFMRYLTKLCDQIVSLVSPEHAETIVWKDEGDEGDPMDEDSDEEESDRLFTFEVAKTKEQEENVTVRFGFKMISSSIRAQEGPADGSIDPSLFRPRLLAGETTQGFITARYIAPQLMVGHHNFSNVNALSLGKILEKGVLSLSMNLDDTALEILVRHGLQNRFPAICSAWIQMRSDIRNGVEASARTEEASVKKKLDNEKEQLSSIFHEMIVEEICTAYPKISRGFFRSAGTPDEDSTRSKTPRERLAHLILLYPKVGDIYQKAIGEADFGTIKPQDYKTAKDRLIMLHVILQKRKDLDSFAENNLVRLLLRDGDPTGASQILDGSAKDSGSYDHHKSNKSWITYFTSWGSGSAGQKLIQEAYSIAANTSDSEFLSNLERLADRGDVIAESVSQVQVLAHTHFEKTVLRISKKLVNSTLRIQEEDCLKAIKNNTSREKETANKRLRMDFITQIEESSKAGSNSHTQFIESIKSTNYSNFSFPSYHLGGRRNWFQDPEVEFKVHVMDLTAEQQHTMQLEPTFVPSPHVLDRSSHIFNLPLGQNIEYAQLLENERILLVVADRQGKLFIFLDTLAGIDGAIKRKKYHKQLHRDKIGQDFLLAYDETKRMMALCSIDKLQLHVFVFDETYRSLQASGSAINLMTWYNSGVNILHMCFVVGGEEILLVDSSAQARIFSLITLLFRPASLELHDIPHRVFTSPDGSCLVVSYSGDSTTSYTAFHWSTFGSNDGISLNSISLACENAVLTSFNRKTIHLVGLDAELHECQSFVLDITRKVTEFMFKEKGTRNNSRQQPITTMHNCLIDCHADVWTRFPVVPAIRRQTISASSKRCLKSLHFVTDRDYRFYASHFQNLIQSFERTTRKPTGAELSGIGVKAVTFEAYITGLSSSKTSCFCAGEWLVDFLCLIPIHIAITKENRFTPLKDGVSSADLEKSLLGAEVGRIVDSISFGWYESIFQSYMVHKPVKVVSSMGEQSVGKSFALNHLVDTSFAGSAMRTTEGVWMSVTPTEDALIVALDFEGVHSIERSAQEDTLLVLFNTALSNLVLFRNNFALSRDITGLFQSFQSSSTVLDPAANPSLFQSILVIIIKDVVDSDKIEITREFSLKFQRIVAEEQDANFISRLHAGKLDIIPWPVIESKQFYKLFPTLKRRLDKQPVTHHTAGEFLGTLKTLMAKLKANDWGALSQTMAAHRAQLLLSLLPGALRSGYTGLDHEMEPLKNFDTDILVDKPDTIARFSLAGPGAQNSDRENALGALRSTENQVQSRQFVEDSKWIAALSKHLDNLVDLRVDHVREWISQNLLRFQTGHANIEELRRTFETAIVDLKANVQLCRMQCATCHLLCTHSRMHDGSHSCLTSHECVHKCDFCEYEGAAERKGCSMSAGHPGKHICVVTAHLCGEPCSLSGKQGCLDECTKVAGHSDGHSCAATIHTCGQLCDLKDIQLSGRVRPYSCSGTCKIAFNEDHDQHVCDVRQCPLSCQLCKRLCAHEDHLHGLSEAAVHLCGQEHSCGSKCSASGICEIDTAPQSIDAVFTGRNDTFQYTKYSQDAKRLDCIKVIAPGDLAHAGAHTHSLDPKAFHFCTTRCESCGYFCTLPLGHSQQEHETSHGSMSQTRWAVDGPDGTTLELEGKRFSSNDEGAPMMCNLVCQSMGRHVHVDYCRADEDTPCDGAEIQHIPTRMVPDPDRSKDFVTHNLYWRRSGFKDPYSKDDQTNFAKCDAMCGGPEHSGNTAGAPGQPSYCTLPLFHPPMVAQGAAAGMGYISNDGHLFACKNPVVMQQAFHVIFAIDRSGSMSSSDRRPLANTPASNRIMARHNDRLGAVYSALHSFWSARHAATAGAQSGLVRRDAYSVILFESSVSTIITNDFTRTPDQLLDALLPHGTAGGTNFRAALESAQVIMEQNFSSERTPVIVFLSDGECSVNDQTVQDLCRAAVHHGKPLSFQAVSFGPDSSSSTLRRMAQIALEVQNNAPLDPLAPAAGNVLSSYSQALDSVRLAETFLGIAESLRKPRGSLLR